MSKGFKTIALFNHKGGVAKTTSSFNIGWALANTNKKVLLVDGDPQCNLTGWILGNSFDKYYENEDTKKNNIFDGVHPAFSGGPDVIKPIRCVKTKNANLLLLPGHMNLSELETQLNFALLKNQQLTTLQNLPGSLHYLIKKCCEKYNIDIVLLDMNPGLGAINQTLFMSSDAFIIPTNPDPFSVMALQTMKKIVPRWNTLAKDLLSSFPDATYKLPHSRHVFLGTLIQRFNLRNKKPAHAYAPLISKVKGTVSSTFFPEMVKNNMIIPNYPDDLVQNSYTLAEVRNFDALVSYSLTEKRPVFDLDFDVIPIQGSVLSGTEKKSNEIKGTFSKLTSELLQEVSQL